MAPDSPYSSQAQRKSWTSVRGHWSAVGTPPLLRHERLRRARDAGHCATHAVQLVPGTFASLAEKRGGRPRGPHRTEDKLALPDARRAALADTLADAGVNITALSAAEVSGRGKIRLLVKDPSGPSAL